MAESAVGSTEEWSPSAQSETTDTSGEESEAKPRLSLPEKDDKGNSLVSSFEVFMSFVDDAESEEDVRVEKVFSRACFNRWLETRTKTPKEPQESFRRALTSHVRGTDQRKPFAENVEAALLVILRQKRSWDCFEKLGRYGFRGKGFHESRRKKERKRKKKLRKRAMYEQSHPMYTEQSSMRYTSYGFDYGHKRMRPHHASIPVPPAAYPMPVPPYPTHFPSMPMMPRPIPRMVHPSWANHAYYNTPLRPSRAPWE